MSEFILFILKVSLGILWYPAGSTWHRSSIATVLYLPMLCEGFCYPVECEMAVDAYRLATALSQ